MNEELIALKNEYLDKLKKFNEEQIQKLKQLNHIKPGPQPFIPADNIEIDWSKPNGVIAKILGVSVPTISKLRKRLGIKPLPRGKYIEP